MANEEGVTALVAEDDDPATAEPLRTEEVAACMMRMSRRG